MRGTVPTLQRYHPTIRVNAIAPSWTATGLTPKAIVEAAGGAVQGPEVPARSVALLMADASRQGQLIYSVQGKLVELEEAVLLKSVAHCLDQYGQPSEDAILCNIFELHAESQ
jgi:NAD(P)-dependent dehydrogenase (short-subunit alcohol dehydrogenase family)